ncbi:hypothetical protein ACSNOI_40240 [Actinomadura kijaniata]|uniref:hypothetical protein n=1 Tax=Actinomadura kijaniata TaxID=46161 RepID=UPI003F1A145F
MNKTTALRLGTPVAAAGLVLGLTLPASAADETRSEPIDVTGASALCLNNGSSNDCRTITASGRTQGTVSLRITTTQATVYFSAFNCSTYRGGRVIMAYGLNTPATATAHFEGTVTRTGQPPVPVSLTITGTANSRALGMVCAS